MANEMAIRMKALDKAGSAARSRMDKKEQLSDAPEVGAIGEDPNDGHTHKVTYLDDNKTGVTDMAGDPPHAHAILNGEVQPSKAGEYISNHEFEPGDSPDEKSSEAVDHEDDAPEYGE